MPQIKFRGVDTEKILSFSVALVDELEQLLQCPRSYFTLEKSDSVFIQDGRTVQGYPFVEVAWFDRGQELQDKTAQIITNVLLSAGYPNVDIIFIPLEKNRYYENGQHF